MSEVIAKVGFGYVDDTDESLKTKVGGRFGLNTPAFLTKFEFNPNAGAEGSLADALDTTIQIGDREYRTRIYPVTKVYDKDGNEITDMTSQEYVDGYNKEWTQKNAVIVHILKCFVTEEAIKQALSVPLNSFKDFCNVTSSLLPAGFQKRPLDTFLEYQWSISKGEDKTYLQTPKNMKGGYFLVAAQTPVGAWEEVKTESGLRYVDKAGNEHPFTRDKSFMESNKAIQQVEGQAASNAALQGAAGATESKW